MRTWKKIKTIRGAINSDSDEINFDNQVNEFTKNKDVFEIKLTEFPYDTTRGFERVATIIYGG